MLGRVIIFLYGLVCYVVSVGTLLYAIGFLGNFVVTKSIDSGMKDPLGQSLLINVGLLGLFAVQHSMMARQWFKRAWTKIVPEPAERSTYVLVSSLLLLLLFWQWRPMSGIIWYVSQSAGRFVLLVVFAAGWLIALTTTILINHFDLFGLRQVYLHLRGRKFTAIPFKTPAAYQFVRHPLYLGWLFAFWSTPTMTVGHMVLAIAMTAYILLAIKFEEKDLISFYGETYRRYRERVPMILPVRLTK
jgi:protein-S-isoprenylcysteine O-methyltransferase Ste14